MPSEMWMVVAVIQPFKLDAVTLALEALRAFDGMTVSDCRGFGREKLAESDEAAGKREAQSDADFLDFTGKIRIEVVVARRDRADSVVEAISRAAHTGRRGDGKIFMWRVAHVVRVRTFDQDEQAL